MAVAKIKGSRKARGKFEIPPGGPTLEIEIELVRQGISLVAGIDEAGRGALAGPLVAAAAVLPLPQNWQHKEAWEALTLELEKVNDSKQLTESTRERLFEVISGVAEVGVGVVSALTIDLIGVGAANKLAMARAVQNLKVRPEHLLIDAFKLPQIHLPQTPLIKGDARSFSIAAASIIAKVTRDRLLLDLAKIYPEYEFARHKGYGTARHMAALDEFGPSTIHRYSYSPVWQAFERSNKI